MGAAPSGGGAVPVRIAVVDYGMGNRRSVEKALQRCGAEAWITEDHAQLRGADGLLLPGVGAFPAAMRAISARGLDSLLRERAAAGVPLLGACLGMQLLFERSSEYETVAGLALLAGRVRALSAPGMKLPHIGWSAVEWRGGAGDCAGAFPPPPRAAAGWPLSAGLPDPTFLYHVHSFIAEVEDEAIVLGQARYGERFPAVVGSGRIFGTQSHPEKSGAHGLRLLENFIALCAAVRALGGGDAPGMEPAAGSASVPAGAADPSRQGAGAAAQGAEPAAGSGRNAPRRAAAEARAAGAAAQVSR